MADVQWPQSGRLPQFHLDGFLQPTLVENKNHHLDIKFISEGISECFLYIFKIKILEMT